MPTAFARFLETASRHSDCIPENQLRGLLPLADLQTLKDMTILKRESDLMEVLCRSCDEDHFVEVRMEYGKPYCFCPYSDSQRSYLAPEDIMVWSFDMGAFLQKTASGLGVQEEVEALATQGVWQVGGFTKDDTRHACYFALGSRVQDALDFIKSQEGRMRRYVLFTIGSDALPRPLSGHAVILRLEELTGVKNGKLAFDRKFFDAFLVNSFRSVIFDPKSGDLAVNGKRIGTVNPSSPEYHFVELLWQNFNEPVPHGRIAAHVYEKTRKAYDETPSKLAHKLKNKIKKASDDPGMIGRIFCSARDAGGETAYVMRNPE